MHVEEWNAIIGMFVFFFSIFLYVYISIYIQYISHVVFIKNCLFFSTFFFFSDLISLCHGCILNYVKVVGKPECVNR